MYLIVDTSNNSRKIFVIWTPDSLTLLYQLWSLTAQTGRLILAQSSYKFGLMGTNYGQDPKNFSKCQQCLSYASCDEMIKNSPCKVGLITVTRTNMPTSKIVTSLLANGLDVKGLNYCVNFPAVNCYTLHPVTLLCTHISALGWHWKLFLCPWFAGYMVWFISFGVSFVQGKDW